MHGAGTTRERPQLARLFFKCEKAPAKPGVSNSLLILQSKQANVMCITLAVSLKVSEPLLISRAAFWGHSDAGISAGARLTKTQSTKAAKQKH